LSSKAYGIVLILVSVTLFIIYLISLVIAPDIKVFDTPLSDLVIRYTILVLMLIIAGGIGYMGYLILTTPVPKPVEEIVKEYKEATK